MAIELDATECRVEFAAAVRDLDLPGRPIAKGTVAGIDIRFVGIVGGRDVVAAAPGVLSYADIPAPGAALVAPS